MTTGDTRETPIQVSKELMKREFSERLQAALVEKGWNQSDLSRRASERSEIEIGPDSISGYIRQKNLPGPVILKAIADALGKEPHELLPTASIRSAAPSPPQSPIFEMSQVGPDSYALNISQVVTKKQAFAVMRALDMDNEK